MCLRCCRSLMGEKSLKFPSEMICCVSMSRPMQKNGLALCVQKLQHMSAAPPLGSWQISPAQVIVFSSCFLCARVAAIPLPALAQSSPSGLAPLSKPGHARRHASARLSRRWDWPPVERGALVSPSVWECPHRQPRCFVVSWPCLSLPSNPFLTLAETISPCAVGERLAPSWWIELTRSPSICSLTGKQKPRKPGCKLLPKLRW